MEILRTIALYVEDKKLPFLVIGGHAVNFYGFNRQTGDIDLVVQGSKSADWSGLIVRLGYSAGQQDMRFARFFPKQLGSWPIDLMFVDDQTFQKLLDDSVQGTIGVAEVRVVSAKHLLTLKLHALKHYQEDRHAKDFLDVVNLLPKAEIPEGELRELCVRYASEDLFQRLLAARR